MDLRRPLHCGAVLVLAAGLVPCVPIPAGIPHRAGLDYFLAPPSNVYDLTKTSQTALQRELP